MAWAEVKEMTVLIEKLIKENPKFHKLPSGSPTSWAVSSDVLKFIHSRLTSDMVTLETGAGQTTVVFAIAGTKHTCITPSKYEADRIKQYCQELGSESNLTFLTESSDMALPRHELIPPKLDFVFIDGAHHFPFPCIDWHYTERKLKVGGILGVDDFIGSSVIRFLEC
jgi:predicted O-methyltransferase YrrM